MSASDTQGGHN